VKRRRGFPVRRATPSLTPTHGMTRITHLSVGVGLLGRFACQIPAHDRGPAGMNPAATVLVRTSVIGRRRSSRLSSLAVLLIMASLALLSAACARREPAPAPVSETSRAGENNPLRNAYFGDLHVHTRFSMDAFVFDTRATPDDAYRYARGGTIDHPSGHTIRLRGGPLDFQAVTDHAEFLGILPAMADPATEISKHPVARRIFGDTTPTQRRAGMRDLMVEYAVGGAQPDPELLDLDIMRSAWRAIIEAAERHYDPGFFTTFVGYEYTSSPEFQNLHRNVIFRGAAVPELPFSIFDSDNPEDLWGWMDANRADGIEALAIPHNPNGSNGLMFRLATFDGDPLDAAYAETRMRNEPIVEVTQVKGTSEVHPLLSPNDEWADFDIWASRIGANIPSDPAGSYVREAYLNGLVLEESEGFNPFRFGLIGSTDTHNGGGTMEEDNYHSKLGVFDGTSELRGSVPLAEPREDGGRYTRSPYALWGASGLAGVWAEENTREAIFDAIKRKETFATSGPRIRVRFFGGFGYGDDLLSDPEMIAEAYGGGVPMGGDLPADGDRAPRFLVWAVRDPSSAPLQRLQIIKGWVEDGVAREQIFDVVCSDGLEPNPSTFRCPDNGAEVDLSDCSLSDNLGDAELRALWSDPHFDPLQRAFYYVRVLENPTCRWSTWDAVRAGVEPRADLPETIQERAWSSPIWLIPNTLGVQVR